MSKETPNNNQFFINRLTGRPYGYRDDSDAGMAGDLEAEDQSFDQKFSSAISTQPVINRLIGKPFNGYRDDSDASMAGDFDIEEEI